MPLTMINAIRSAETEADRALAAAKRQAAEAVDAAERAARALLDEVRKEARANEKRLIEHAETAAHEQLTALAEENRNHIAALRHQATGRMQTAVEVIARAVLTGKP